MKSILALSIFIDACGWEIIKADPFIRDVAPHRRRLRSVFGYSSACIPSILSGRYPNEHRNWSYFVYDPERSPFRPLRWLRWLPTSLTSRRRVRNVISKWAKRQLGFRGYFDLYNMPFRQLQLFDFTEKRSPLQPGGMNRGTNIFDVLQDRGIPYHVSEPGRGEAENLAALEQGIAAESIDFAFLYWPELDGLMHRVGNNSREVGRKLRSYETNIRKLLAAAVTHYESVRLHVFSDHGMANCHRHIDLKANIEELGYRMPGDYAAVYDSTMARFWFFNPRARKAVVRRLHKIHDGEILSDAELTDLETYFEDRYFGELIFLMREGVLIVPSHMGERPIRAMHGYHPDEPHSYAALMSNMADIPAGINAIPDMYRLMVRDATAAHEANRAAKAGPAHPAAHADDDAASALRHTAPVNGCAAKSDSRSKEAA